jgi:methylated-DNA-protein-cysteine methyltransferase-like protein
MAGSDELKMSTIYERVYSIVRQIPEGRVATYGQIARLLGTPHWARQVGYALAALRDDQIPWHRVVNAKGGISPRGKSGYEELQRVMLENEGIVFDEKGFIPLKQFQWSYNEASLTSDDLSSSSTFTNNE